MKACPLCGERQNLINVLNFYRVATELHEYDHRHAGVHSILADMIEKKFPFFMHLTPTDTPTDIAI